MRCVGGTQLKPKQLKDLGLDKPKDFTDKVIAQEIRAVQAGAQGEGLLSVARAAPPPGDKPPVAGPCSSRCLSLTRNFL